MARMTKQEHEQVLEKLAGTNIVSEEISSLVDKLRSDFDESISVDVDEVRKDYENKIKEAQDNYNRVLGERDEARRLYKERFFSNAQEEAQQIVDRTKKDSPKGIRSVLGMEG